MRTHFLVLFFYIISGTLTAQDLVSVYSSENQDAPRILADNNERYPVTVELTLFDVKNVQLDHPKTSIHVLPAHAKAQTLVNLTPAIGKRWGYQLSYMSHMGDVTSDNYDLEFVYHLPFKKGASYIISQGYQGKASHQGENALDFNMPDGAIICAARGGTVVKVVDEHNRSCPDESCNKYNNVLLILHDDGSFSEYAHLKKNGSLVEVGQVVAMGDEIAISGDTGWTTGPHLHFVVFAPRKGHQKSLQTDFLIQDGRIERLGARKTYARDY